MTLKIRISKRDIESKSTMLTKYSDGEKILVDVSGAMDLLEEGVIHDGVDEQ